MSSYYSLWSKGMFGFRFVWKTSTFYSELWVISFIWWIVIIKSHSKVLAVFCESSITFCYLPSPENPADHVLDGEVVARDVDIGEGLTLCRNGIKGAFSILLVLTLMEGAYIPATENLNSRACLIDTNHENTRVWAFFIYIWLPSKSKRTFLCPSGQWCRHEQAYDHSHLRYIQDFWQLLWALKSKIEYSWRLSNGESSLVLGIGWVDGSPCGGMYRVPCGL